MYGFSSRVSVVICCWRAAHFQAHQAMRWLSEPGCWVVSMVGICSLPCVLNRSNVPLSLLDGQDIGDPERQGFSPSSIRKGTVKSWCLIPNHQGLVENLETKHLGTIIFSLPIILWKFYLAPEGCGLIMFNYPMIHRRSTCFNHPFWWFGTFFPCI
jgi:hypothetical protein